MEDVEDGGFPKKGWSLRAMKLNALGLMLIERYYCFTKCCYFENLSLKLNLP